MEALVSDEKIRLMGTLIPCRKICTLFTIQELLFGLSFEPDGLIKICYNRPGLTVARSVPNKILSLPLLHDL